MPAASTTAKKSTSQAPTQSQSSLKTLTTKLKDIQASFNDIWRFVQDFKEDATASDVLVRLDRIDDLWDKFGEALIEVRSHDEFVDADNTYEQEREQFSDR